MSELTMKGITKRYDDGTLAVDDLDLEISDGELMILVGPSGCGKTTALRMIAGLEEITEGELWLDGQMVNELPPKARDMAMVFQNYALYPHMTVRQNMSFGLEQAKLDKAEIARKVAEAAETLDLTEHLDRKPAQLSGGQRQRVAMGRAIVRAPKAFLMDEPLSNLDAKLRTQMRTELARIQRDLGTTTVYVTHDQIEAMTLGDRVAVMRGGVLQQVGSPQELYAHPANLFVAGFMGSPAINLLPASVEDEALRTPIGDVPLDGRLRDALGRAEGDRMVVVGLRPEHLLDAGLGGGNGGGDAVTYTGEVAVLEAMGAEYYAYFDLPEAGEVGEVADLDRADAASLADAGLDPVARRGGNQLVARLPLDSQVREGAPLTLRFEPRRLHVFDPRGGRRLSDPGD
ncbi:MAG TPA: sn-glycerol-3-phosphate ABC transporter ATP-binding protein UgpC [Solirubrobacteraceae bacterium]|nr:sn-glycerol-3-phosphate ABC transporter ATP-binding protein UgpC [Solirubrobacteraceae bacterium]